jgi:murein DD-endopeptidase MepM/ murein hydrolase activator NlpD
VTQKPPRPGKSWTIVIVPSDNEGARTYSVTEGGRKAILWGVGVAAAMVMAAGVYLFTPYATPANQMMMAENARLKAQLEGIDDRLLALADTIDEITARDRQIRALADMPDDTSVIAAAEALQGAPLDQRLLPREVAVLPSAPARKPFLNRLGFGDNRGAIDEMSRRATDLAQSFRAVSDTLTRNLERIANTPSIMPTSGWLSSHFSASRLHPILHENRPHEGIDVSAPRNAPIIAPANGRVRNVGFESGYGNTFEIDHGNGIVTKYAHCSRIVVRNGQIVARSQLIATVGNTGLTIGPHLHYEVHVNGKPVDPLRYVLPERIADDR